MFWVEERAVAEHGAGDSEQPVGDRSKSSAMGVSSTSQGLVLGFADGITLDGHATPMVDGIDQAH